MTTTQTPSRRPSGMFGLIIVLAGQAVSILASSMTGFALSIWVFQKTSSATSLGIMQTAFVLPYLLIIPLAGVMVDRYNRKLMMMVSDLAAGMGTLAILILSFSDNLQVWHFYVINIVIGLGNAFQWPAYSAAITTMVPKEQYGRANGMMTFVQAGPGVVAPLLSGALMPHIGLNGILIIDVATFLFAIGMLMFVHIPPPIRTVEGQEGKGSLLQEAAFGFKYIFKRPSLLGYVMMLFVANLFLGFPNSVHVPLILSRTGNDSLIFGAVETAGAISWTVGSLVMSAWGGPKRRMHGALFGWVFYCLFGNILFALGNGLEIWIPAILIGKPVVVVAMRLPYDLATFPQASTFVCTYGILEPSMRAAARALFGFGKMKGRLQVSIPGVGGMKGAWEALTLKFSDNACAWIDAPDSPFDIQLTCYNSQSSRFCFPWKRHNSAIILQCS